MGSKESVVGVPEDATIICTEKKSIVMMTSDASFDYSPEGQEFLLPGAKNIQPKAMIHTGQ